MEREGKTDIPEYEKVKAIYEENEKKRVTDSIDSLPVK